MDDDEELRQLRAKRLAELQAQSDGQPGGDQRQGAQQREQREQQEEEMRNNILSQILTQEARARRKFSAFNSLDSNSDYLQLMLLRL